MTDKTNPRAELDAALAGVRRGYDLGEPTERIAMEATVVCMEALSLLVDAQLAAVKPKRKPEPEPDPEPDPDPRESLPDDTPVGHGWVTARRDRVRDLFKPEGRGGRFTWWLDRHHGWGQEAQWRESDLPDTRPATVGDLRRVGLPVTEWPDVTAPETEPKSEPEPMPVEPPEWSVVLVGADAWQRVGDRWHVAGVEMGVEWADLCRTHAPTVIYTPEAS